MDDSNQEFSPKPKREDRWYLKWWSVFLWLSILGPFALPFLWKSKDFNLFWKWFWTLAISILTMMLVWSTWKIIQIVVEHFRSAGLM